MLILARYKTKWRWMICFDNGESRTPVEEKCVFPGCENIELEPHRVLKSKGSQPSSNVSKANPAKAKLSFEVIQSLKRRSGLDLRAPHEIQLLVNDIELKTREHIGLNTMKRLLGFLDEDRTPRESTLDVIARYLGYDNWQMVSDMEQERFSSAFGSSNDELDMERLSAGSRVHFTCNPEREVIIRYLGNHKFVVERSVNSKLRQGDQLEIWHMIRRYPLHITSVVRRGEHLGPFTAGKVGGLTSLEVLKDTELDV